VGIVIRNGPSRIGVDCRFVSVLSRDGTENDASGDLADFPPFRSAKAPMREVFKLLRVDRGLVSTQRSERRA
jgi:hypothetical protein